MIELKKNVKSTTFPIMVSSPRIEKQLLKLELSMMHRLAKAKKGCKSLNECLYRGPVILEDLCGLLLRFRIYKVALTADIEKTFK